MSSDELMTEEQVRTLAARLGHNISGSVIFGESIIHHLDAKDARIKKLEEKLQQAWLVVWNDSYSQPQKYRLFASKEAAMACYDTLGGKLFRHFIPIDLEVQG
jgi:hypothetical protein